MRAVVAGVLLLAAGVGLLVEVGWYWTAHARLEEPANPGKTPNPSKSSLFFRNTEPMSPEEFDRLSRADLEERREQSWRDAVWGRIHLYAIAPAGLMLAAAGLWLLSSGSRTPRK